jgi:hypothetical protein
MDDRYHLQQLKEKLESLQRHLESVEHLDDQSRQLLDDVATEIEGALADEQPERLTNESFTERLVVAARDFESHHPTFSRTLESIVDLLGQIGI